MKPRVQARHIGFPMLAFALSKASVFLAPLLLASVMPLAAYGSLEVGLAMGGIMSPVLACGMAAAVPYFLIKERMPVVRSGIFLYSVWLSGSVLAIAVMLPLLYEGTLVALPLLCGAIAAVQVMLASFMKTYGRPAAASFIESGMYLVMLPVACVAFFASAHANLAAVYWSLVGYLGALAAGCLMPLVLAPQGMKGTLDLARRALTYGVAFVLPSLGMLSVVNGGRVLSGYLLGPDSTALYGVLFRVAAPAILVHQLLATIFFRQLYVSSAERLDKYFSMILGAVLFLAFAGYLIVPPVLSPYLPMFADMDPPVRDVYLLISVQVVVWVGLALMEVVLARENRGWAQLWVLLSSAVVGALLVALLYAHKQLDLVRLCRVQLVVFLSAYFGLHSVLHGAGVRLSKAAGVVGVTALGYAVHAIV